MTFRRALRLLLLVLPCMLLASACGGNDHEDRPTVVASIPADGEVMDNVVARVAVVYDDEIRLLNGTTVTISSLQPSLMEHPEPLPATRRRNN